MPQAARSTWIFAGILLAIGTWSYSNSFAGVLFGDDEKAITQNASIRSLWPLSGPLSPPSDTTVAARPIANLTFAINYALADGTTNLQGYHAFNLVVHLLAGLGLSGIVRRTLLTPVLRERYGRASAPIAFAVAAVWMAHPLHTQAVTFLAQRVESLMSLFYVSTIYCGIRSAETNFRSRAWTIAAVGLCALGMGTKETMISAPIMMGLWIWICRPDVSLLRAPRALLTGLAATMIIVVILSASGARAGSAGFGVQGWTWWSYLRTQADVIVHYLRLAFWPRPLVFQYGWLPAESWRAVLPQLVLLVSLGLATGVALIKRKPIGLAGAWFFLILAPSSSVVPIATEVAAEHRMYLPLAAVVAVVVLGVFAAGRKLHAGFRSSWILLVAIVVPLAMATHARNGVYASAESIAADTVNNRPDNGLARLTYGTYLVGEKRFTEAESHLRAALALPLSPSTDASKARSLAHLYLGMALIGQNRVDDGSRELEQAIALRADLDRAYPVLAEAQLTQRRTGAAVATLNHAVARRPDDVALLKRLAWVLATSSDAAIRNGERAVRQAERAVTLTNSGDPIAFDVLAAAHAETGQFDKALAALARAVGLVRASGPNDLIPMLRNHLELFEAKRPVRTPDW